MNVVSLDTNCCHAPLFHSAANNNRTNPRIRGMRTTPVTIQRPEIQRSKRSCKTRGFVKAVFSFARPIGRAV